MAYKKLQPTKSLPPLPRLKVRRPTLNKATNECVVLMSSLLNCWAANGESSATCKPLEQDLKVCMESFKGPKKEELSSINYHAARLYPKLRGKVND